MTTYSVGEIPAALARVVDANGATFVSVSQSHNTRMALLGLLEAYGFADQNLRDTVTPNDLATLYASARKKHSIGYAVAVTLAKKYGQNPLMDGLPDMPATPPPPPEYPAPAPPPPPPPSGEYATRSELRAVERLLETRASHADIDGLAARTADTEASLMRLAEKVDILPDAIAAGLPDMVAKAVAAQSVTRLEVATPDAPPVPLGLTHRQTPRIIAMLAAGVNVYLYGPAGSGKTTAGQQCADAFKLPFYFAAKVESEYMLLGFKDARGETVRTQFREAYEHGGVFLFDELDGSSAGAVVALNAALANGVCPFPDGVVRKHEQFKCIGAGNTALSGATRQYVGRNQLDAASVDRFAFLPFDYDDALERTLATNANWCRYVQAVRAAVKDRALPHLVTPRATYDGCKLLASGIDVDTVADAVVWKGLDRSTVAQLQAVVGDVADYFDMQLVA